MDNTLTQLIANTITTTLDTDIENVELQYVSTHTTGIDNIQLAWHDKTSNLVWISAGRITNSKLREIESLGLQFGSEVVPKLLEALSNADIAILGIRCLKKSSQKGGLMA